MELEILSTTVAGGKTVRKGEIINASESDARILLAYKCARVPVAETPTEPEEPAAETEETPAKAPKKGKKK